MLSYGGTRNFKDGAVSRLSPYVSRGVLSTKLIYNHVKDTGLPWHKVERFIQELAWRDFFQLVWKQRGDAVFSDLLSSQFPLKHMGVPSLILNQKTGIHAIDESLDDLRNSGYMHNHMRMYIASVCCNIFGFHWRKPADWMYSQLLDGDLGSNHLSWQWVVGTFSKKKYYANQDNINKFFYSNQKGTFLDHSYEQLPLIDHSELSGGSDDFVPPMEYPTNDKISAHPSGKTLIYNYYNLDPDWHVGEDLGRVLFFDKDIFERFPVAQKCLAFATELSRNIPGISIYSGDFASLKKQLAENELIVKEHPLNVQYDVTKEARDWLCSYQG